MEDNELRDRIADIVYESLESWGPTLLDEHDYVAQALIDELGLELRRDQLWGGHRVIGKWVED